MRHLKPPVVSPTRDSEGTHIHAAWASLHLPPFFWWKGMFILRETDVCGVGRAAREVIEPMFILILSCNRFPSLPRRKTPPAGSRSPSPTKSKLVPKLLHSSSTKPKASPKVRTSLGQEVIPVCSFTYATVMRPSCSPLWPYDWTLRVAIATNGTLLNLTLCALIMEIRSTAYGSSLSGQQWLRLQILPIDPSKMHCWGYRLTSAASALALGCRPMSVVTSETSGELAVVLIQMKHRTLPTSDLSASVRALGDGRG